MKELIQEMLGVKATSIVERQIKNGVPNIPLDQMNRRL